METGQDLQMVINPKAGFYLKYRHRTGALASEISRPRANAAIPTFSNSQSGQVFPISPHPNHRKFHSTLHSSVEF